MASDCPRARGRLPWDRSRLSARAIAARLHRSTSTISREIHRNGGGEAYRAVTADEAATHRARPPKTTRR
ncbi:helix-turn-helix domain-containing protein [Agromyces sp. LHK192]|uniref:helix-turn-helix domain-containing protein n=1 Tax=Agromyces sp. LHK192 TaxID=2498704 RepID=UPI0035180F21